MGQCVQLRTDRVVSVEQIRRATEGWSIEVTPAVAKKIDRFADCLVPGTVVNVTFLPGSDPIETVAVARRLNEEGMVAVPHIAARSLKDCDQLERFLAALTSEAKVEEVLVIGGGIEKPLGSYDCSLQIIESGLLQKYGIRRVGVAGHPEGSPDMSDEAIAEALAAKNKIAKRDGLAMYIETQFCFEAHIVLNWEKRIRMMGNQLPVRIGIPGPATIKTLFRFAQISGIGPSTRFITKQARNVTKLMTVQSPHQLLADLAKGMAEDPDCLIENFHFYPFGGFAKTVEYAKAVAAGEIQLLAKGGFDVVSPAA